MRRSRKINSISSSTSLFEEGVIFSVNGTLVVADPATPTPFPTYIFQTATPTVTATATPTENEIVTVTAKTNLIGIDENNNIANNIIVGAAGTAGGGPYIRVGGQGGDSTAGPIRTKLLALQPATGVRLGMCLSFTLWVRGSV